MPIIINPATVTIPLKDYDHSWKITYFDPADVEQVLLDSSDSNTNYLVASSFTLKSLRTGIGSFSIMLFNPMGNYNTQIVKATRIKTYCDLLPAATTPTTVIFDGRVDSIKHSLTSDNKFYMELYGRKDPQLADLHITIRFNGAQAKAAIQSIIDTYFSGVFTYANIDTNMTGPVYGEYIEQRAVNVIADILKQVTYDGFIDMSGDIYTFPVGGRRNTLESITYGNNLLPFGSVGQDFIDEVNRTTVYGNVTENTLLLRTKNDTALQSASWIKSKIVTASNLQTTTTVEQKATTELVVGRLTPVFGTLISSKILVTLNPGESINCSAQAAGITGFYATMSITHSLNNEGKGNTSVDLNRTEITDFVEIKQIDDKVTALSTQNINGMKDTAILLTFVDSSSLSSLGGLTLSDGRLTLPSSISQGIATSITEPTDDNVTFFEVRNDPNSFCNISYYQVSNNGGQSYNDNGRQYSLIGDVGTAIAFTTTGKNVVVKITLKSDATNTNPQLESFSLLVK